MIALPVHGSSAWRVLALIVEEPGALTAEMIADRLHPEPRHVGPFTPASYRAHVEALRAHRDEDAQAARVKAVGVLLHRLQGRGLVEKCAGLRVAPWFEAKVEKRGLHKALLLAQPIGGPKRDLGAHRALIELVRASPGSVRALGAGGGGWRWEAYTDLGEWGVLVTPTRRTATEAGRALVAGSGEPPIIICHEN